MNPLNLLILTLSVLTTVTQSFPFPFPKDEAKVEKKVLAFKGDDVNKFVANRTSETQNVTGLIYTGGSLTNVTNSSSVVVYPLGLNVTNVTLPELSNVSSYFNTSSVSANITSLVISSSNKSLEATGFYFAIAYPNETVVVAENVSIGLIVANSSKAAGRGTLIVDAKNFIYSSISYPIYPIGFVTKSHDVVFYYEPSLVTILNPSSPLYTSNFSHFNTSQVTSNISSEVIPIFYSSYVASTKKGSKDKGDSVTSPSAPKKSGKDKGNSVISSSIPKKGSKDKGDSVSSSSSSSSSSSGSIPNKPLNTTAVVIEVANVTVANHFKLPTAWSNDTIVIFASNGTGFIDQSALWMNSTYYNRTIAAGFLTPEKASILASFAISAGLSSLKDLMSILPGFN